MLLARKRSTGRSGSNLEQADRGPYGTRLPRERSAARHGLSLDAGLRKHAEKLEEDGGGRHAGDAAGVEGRRDLDEIGADEIEAPEIADQTLGFKCRDRRSRHRRSFAPPRPPTANLCRETPQWKPRACMTPRARSTRTSHREKSAFWSLTHSRGTRLANCAHRGSRPQREPRSRPSGAFVCRPIYPAGDQPPPYQMEVTAVRRALHNV
jgi:hypothetical protein